MSPDYWCDDVSVRLLSHDGFLVSAFTSILGSCSVSFDDMLIKHGMQEGDLIFGVVAAIEEEKDPRCLLVAFRIIQLLAKLYPDPDGPISSCADELFDVLSRYFPISFNAVSILRGISDFEITFGGLFVPEDSMCRVFIQFGFLKKVGGG